MSAEELYREKQQLIADTEKSLRRKLSAIERNMLAMIFERILDRLEVTSSTLTNSAENLRLLNQLGRIHKDFTRPANVKVVAEFARVAMQLPGLSEGYFASISESMAEKLSDVRRMSDGLLRARLGLTDGSNLQSGGYLQNVIEDVTVRNKLQDIVGRAIREGGDLGSLRLRIREYLTGTEEADGALTKQADQQLFDTLQEVDRAADLANADALGLMGAMYAGGLIETTREICCKLNARVWTREEMDALNKQALAGKKWSGYKGDIRIYCGGHNCRHGWNWISNARLLRLRPDLEIITKGGKQTLRYKVGVTPQAFNTGCDKLQRVRRKLQRTK